MILYPVGRPPVVAAADVAAADVYVCIYIYIYTYRVREREREYNYATYIQYIQYRYTTVIYHSI